MSKAKSGTKYLKGLLLGFAFVVLLVAFASPFYAVEPEVQEGSEPAVSQSENSSVGQDEEGAGSGASSVQSEQPQESEQPAEGEALPPNGAPAVFVTGGVSDAAGLEQAILNAASGDTIYIESNITLTKTLSIGKDLNFAANGGTFTIKSSGNLRHFTISVSAKIGFGGLVLEGNDTGGGVTINPNLSVELKNAIFQNCKNAAGVIGMQKADHLILSDVQVLDSKSTGIMLSNGGGSLSLISSKVMRTQGASGISILAGAEAFKFSMVGSSVSEGTNTKGMATGIAINGNELTVDIVSSTISDNISSSSSLIYGGGLRVMAMEGATSGNIVVNVTDSDLSRNELLNGYEEWAQINWGGGAMVVMSRSTGMRFTDTVLTKVNVTTNITSSIFSGNTVQTDLTNYYKGGGEGSAIFTDGIVNIKGSKFLENTSYSSGAISLNVGAANGTALNISKDDNGQRTLFQGNVAGSGAAISTNYYDYSELISDVIHVNVKDADFIGNKALGYGSAVYIIEYFPNASSQPKVFENCTFIGNRSTSSVAVPGAAFVTQTYGDPSNVNRLSILLKNTLFEDNYSVGGGGGVYIASKVQLTVEDSVFRGNEVERENYKEKGAGGAIYFEKIDTSLVSITNTTFADNKVKTGYYTKTNPYASRFTNVISSTTPFLHPLNNHDINYVGGYLATYFTVKFETYGGTAIADAQVINGTNAVEPSPPPEKPHSVFIGWFKDEAYTTRWMFSTNKVMSNTTIYAKWEPDKHAVVFNSMGGSDVASISDVACDSIIAKPEAPVRTQFRFIGWYIDTEYSVAWNFETDTVADNITLYAMWEEIIIYTVFYSIAPSTDAFANDTGFEKGDTATVKDIGASRIDGYTFQGWNTKIDATGIAYYPGDTIVMTENITLHAMWEEIPTYTVFYSIAPCTDAFANDAGFEKGETATVKGIGASRIGGHTFQKWNTRIDALGVSYYPGDTIVMTENITLHAIWERNPSDSSSSESGGTAGPGKSSSSSSSEAAPDSGGGIVSESGQGTSDSGVLIIDPIVPSVREKTWSLLNLLLTIEAVFAAIILVIAMLHGTRARKYQNEEEANYTESQRPAWKQVLQVLAVLAAPLAFLVFITTQSLVGGMAITDRWTIAFVLISIVQMVLWIIARRGDETVEGDDKLLD